jgi:hypothetical protein
MDNFVHIFPRKVRIGNYDEAGVFTPLTGELEILTRPIRMMTAQGPRVAIVRSEQVPEGCGFEFEVHLAPTGGPVTMEMLSEVAAYWRYKGLGQWRNGGWGRMEAVRLD